MKDELADEGWIGDTAGSAAIAGYRDRCQLA
jgi:hypothetical protein